MLSSLKSLTILYYCLVAVFMSTVIFELPLLHYAVKPLFMVLLMAFHYLQLNKSFGYFSKMIQFGLFFSWLGDIALMFDEKLEILFIFGLGFFLIAHLGYVLAFVKSIKDSGIPFNTRKSILLSVPLIIFMGAFFYFIKDGLSAELFVPVLAYTIVIGLMGVTAILRIGHTKSKNYRWILIGAILFIFSDCVIAINKFVVDFQHDAVLNMILYLTAQYMITVGAIYYVKNISSPQSGS